MDYFKNLNIVILIFSVLILSSGCKNRYNNDQLDKINEAILVNPDSAFNLLSNINPDTLNEYSRNYYDMLVIKANDKLHHRLSSDSIILRVIEYFSHSDDKLKYAEALYYGGRVMLSLGDYPEALKYFQHGLEVVPDYERARIVKGNLLSQTGYLLIKLRMYDDANDYIKKAIRMEEEDCDTMNLIMDKRLLGSNLMRSQKYDEAEIALAESLALDKDTSSRAITIVHMGAIKHEKGKIDSALLLIRGMPEKIKNNQRYFAMAHAARIYLALGQLDTAYYYANILAHAENSDNVKTGYELLATTELRNLLPPDSVNEFYKRYGRFSKDFVEQNGLRASIIQNTEYNYSRLERERRAAEISRKNIWSFSKIVLLLLAIALLAIGAGLILHRGKVGRLKQQIQNLMQLNDHLSQLLDNIAASTSSDKQDVLESNQNETTESKIPEEKIPDNQISIIPRKRGRKKKVKTTEYSSQTKVLLKQIKEKLHRLKRQAGELPGLPPEVKQSEVFLKLCNMTYLKKPIADNSEIWSKLDILFDDNFPDFKSNLELLFGGKISMVLSRTCMLMKLGFGSLDIAILSSRQINTISSRKSELKKFLDQYGLTDLELENLIQLI